jgi:hypothetical protein
MSRGVALRMGSGVELGTGSGAVLGTGSGAVLGTGSGAALNLPGPARVRADGAGRPCVVNGLQVESVRESWLVEDRWWTGRPLRRRYWELVGSGGQNLVVFHELAAAGTRGAWFVQRA